MDNKRIKITGMQLLLRTCIYGNILPQGLAGDWRINMFKYIVKRILQAIPLLLIITIITFLIINIAPGDPIYMFIDPESAKHVNIEVIRHKYGLDQPLYLRYFVWLKGILKLDFGISFLEKRPVLEMINQRLFATISLMLVSVIISFLIAIPAGVVSAIKRNSIADYFFQPYHL